MRCSFRDKNGRTEQNLFVPLSKRQNHQPHYSFSFSTVRSWLCVLHFRERKIEQSFYCGSINVLLVFWVAWARYHRISAGSPAAELVPINIANTNEVAPKDYKPEEDPALFHFTKTGTGPLSSEWKNKSEFSLMCAYKLIVKWTCVFPSGQQTQKVGESNLWALYLISPRLVWLILFLVVSQQILPLTVKDVDDKNLNNGLNDAPHPSVTNIRSCRNGFLTDWPGLCGIAGLIVFFIFHFILLRSEMYKSQWKKKSNKTKKANMLQ